MLEDFSTKVLSSIKKQLTEALSRAEEAEKKVTELSKKNDDYKKAYHEAKINLGKT